MNNVYVERSYGSSVNHGGYSSNQDKFNPVFKQSLEDRNEPNVGRLHGG